MGGILFLLCDTVIIFSNSWTGNPASYWTLSSSGNNIIHNCVKEMYYVGQAERVFDRAYMHFVKNEGNPEIYEDFSLGDEFCISLIPTENTSFLTLNELEDNAIRAYDSFENGYNRMPGNIIDKHIFRNDDYQKIAELILDKIKETELILSLSNNHKRISFAKRILSEHGLPYNLHFISGFAKMIMGYQKANKKSEQRVK